MSRKQALGYVVVFSRAGDFIVTVNLAYTVLVAPNRSVEASYTVLPLFLTFC